MIDVEEVNVDADVAGESVPRIRLSLVFSEWHSFACFEASKRSQTVDLIEEVDCDRKHRRRWVLINTCSNCGLIACNFIRENLFRNELINDGWSTQQFHNQHQQHIYLQPQQCYETYQTPILTNRRYVNNIVAAEGMCCWCWLWNCCCDHPSFINSLRKRFSWWSCMQLSRNYCSN